MSKSTATSTAIIFVLVRYLVKKTGSIVSKVRSINEQGQANDYIVTLNRNGSHTCTCEGNAVYHRRCKHIKHCVAIENARAAAKKEAALTQKPMTVDAVIAAVETHLSEQTKASKKPVFTTAAALIKSDDIPLAGNKGFSVLKR